MANPTIYINPLSGSIKILGAVDFVDAEGNVLETKENVKFCGCSLSKDKPWCDGSHKAITGQKGSANLNQGENGRLSNDP
jgi:CDGSH-type Zn-finger protein